MLTDQALEQQLEDLRTLISWREVIKQASHGLLFVAPFWTHGPCGVVIYDHEALLRAHNEDERNLLIGFDGRDQDFDRDDDEPESEYEHRCYVNGVLCTAPNRWFPRPRSESTHYRLTKDEAL